jgi:NADH-quinone oxidoreductase subunit J
MIQKALFIVFAAFALASALNVLIQRRPLYSALSLIGAMASLSALYVMLGAEFIATMQIIVYAGAIMVLFVFVIMLLNEPKDQPYIEKSRNLKYLAIPFGALMLLEAFYVARSVGAIRPRSGGVGTTQSVATKLFTDYLLPFEVTSVLILMAIVGAIALAKRED